MLAVCDESLTRGPLLIVDDVFTTEDSMHRQRGSREAIGLVRFERGWALLPPWIFALFSCNLPGIRPS